MELYIAPTNDQTRAWYAAAAAAYEAKPYEERDAGLDAFCGSAVTRDAGAHEKLDLGVRAAAYDPVRRHFRAFWLLPRSSISKTPLRMANSVGLIDAGYRGVLLGATDFHGTFQVNAGDRYFQIVGADLLPWTRIHVVDVIPGGATLRGEGGFGSTGRSHSFSPLPTIPADAPRQLIAEDEMTGVIMLNTLNNLNTSSPE